MCPEPPLIGCESANNLVRLGPLSCCAPACTPRRFVCTPLRVQIGPTEGPRRAYFGPVEHAAGAGVAQPRDDSRSASSTRLSGLAEHLQLTGRGRGSAAAVHHACPVTTHQSPHGSRQSVSVVRSRAQNPASHQASPDRPLSTLLPHLFIPPRCILTSSPISRQSIRMKPAPGPRNRLPIPTLGVWS